MSRGVAGDKWPPAPEMLMGFPLILSALTLPPAKAPAGSVEPITIAIVGPMSG